MPPGVFLEEDPGAKGDKKGPGHERAPGTAETTGAPAVSAHEPDTQEVVTKPATEHQGGQGEEYRREQ